ncbi:hypothetical protein HNO52_01325 [Billgrantia diversa]|uniref:hypothetical protein n=1 Tax=Halomonas sp. MCCC 1A13316 TaxID=2733487 RepID=UPI0018A595BE|nr:hypothetical protein [Halomonas sp. MCCC 1A13316]QOR37297.1 hypothetical protein HNO52_01325 [Halomonas sp. MCCC 1A13316]
MPVLRRTTLLNACLVLLLPLSALAQQPMPEYQAYEDALARGERQANVWQYGWAGVYATSLAFNGYQSSEADDRDDRYDARVGVVKSALALAGTLMDDQPHPAAYRELREGDGNIESARRLLHAVAEEERQRRSLRARLGSLAINAASGLLIGVGDGRGRDGAINFATGMLISELQLQTQPRQASVAINRFKPARVSLGDIHLEGEYALLVAPNQVGVALRY